MEQKKLFSIFSKKSVNISVDVPIPILNESVDNPVPVKAIHEPTQNVQCVFNVILDSGDIDSGPATPILDVSFI